MNVAVLAPPEKLQELIEALAKLQSLGIPAFGLKIRDNWDKPSRLGLGVRVEKASHVLLLSTPEIADKPWFVFIAGFALGKKARLALYRLDPSWEPPVYLSRTPLLDGETEFVEYYRLERVEWTIQEERHAARSSLLEIGISFHAESLAGCVAEGNIHAVELFLKAGFHPNSRDKHGVPLLCLAARHKHIGVADLLLEYGASLDSQSEDRGYSPLMDATLSGSTELVDLFLSREADPNLQSKDGQTALVIAVGRGDAAIAGRLLASGADPDLPDKLGFSARKYVKLFKTPALLALLGGDGA